MPEVKVGQVWEEMQDKKRCLRVELIEESSVVCAVGWRDAKRRIRWSRRMATIPTDSLLASRLDKDV